MARASVPALLLGLLLAGCAQSIPEPVATSSAPAPPPAILYELQVDKFGQVDTPSPCPPFFSCSSNGPLPLAFLGSNETLEGFGLSVEVSGFPATEPPAVQWTVECWTHDGQRCDPPFLAMAEGMTVRLEARGLATPAGASILLRAESGPVPPANAGGLFDPSFDVAGFLRIRADPSVAVPLLEAPVSFDGVAGACVFVVEPDCSFPSGTGHFQPVEGRVRRISLEATWPDTASLPKAMWLSASCQARSYEACRGSDDHSVRGKSPLRLELPIYDLREAAGLSIRVYPDYSNNAIPRQDYHVEGVIHFLPLEEDEDRPRVSLTPPG